MNELFRSLSQNKESDFINYLKDIMPNDNGNIYFFLQLITLLCFPFRDLI